MKSVRALGVATLLFAAAAVATGVWWLGLTQSRVELIEERAAIEVTRSSVRLADVLVAQAIVFALDEETGTVNSSAVTEARRVASDAVVELDRNSLFSDILSPSVAEYRASALVITEELATGAVETARARYSGELAESLTQIDQAADRRLASIAESLASITWRAQTVSIVCYVFAGISLVGLLGVIQTAARARPGVSTSDDVVVDLTEPTSGRNRPTDLVIQLPTGPNTLSPRRRHPKVEDLGWLVGEVIKPYQARGWEFSFECPVVGADCDPADVREILNTLLHRAETSDADRIGIGVRPRKSRVEVIVADDGASIFGPGSYLSASDPVQLRSSVRTRSEADTAELRWSRAGGLNVAVLDLPRLGIVVPIGASR